MKDSYHHTFLRLSSILIVIGMSWGLLQERRFISRIITNQSWKQLLFITNRKMSIEKQQSDRFYDVYIALGCNIGDRVQSLHTAYRKLNEIGKVKKTAYLYHSKPMYHEEQPSFLNSACLLSTTLSPHDLLKELKKIEKDIGREETFRNGPRNIDLDIILYDNEQVQSNLLQIPHPRMSERGFVLKPMCDLSPSLKHPILQKTMKELCEALPLTALEELHQVIPCRNSNTKRTRYLRLQSGLPLIMGILNVTPDSFSDGGKYNNSIEAAVELAITMTKEGAQIIDIGGESTRPYAEAVEVEAEINRIVPVIRYFPPPQQLLNLWIQLHAFDVRGIREKDENIVISVDTRKFAVAKAAIDAGADIVNDVSAGKYDQEMLPYVIKNFVPYIAMHMRGEPATMLDEKHSTYKNVTKEVIEELLEVCKTLDNSLPRWLQVIDPGVGFAKSAKSNLSLLSPQNLIECKTRLDNRPLLVGLSRKRFLTTMHEQITQRRSQLILNDDLSQSIHQLSPEELKVSVYDRDLLTAGACCATILGRADIIRVHNVKEVRKICDSFVAIIE